MLFAFLEMSLAGGCLVLVIIVLRGAAFAPPAQGTVFLVVDARAFAPAAAGLSNVASERVRALGSARRAALQLRTRRRGPRVKEPGSRPPRWKRLSPPTRGQRPSRAPASEAALTPALTLVWLAVALLLLLLLGLAYARGLRRFQRAEPMNDPFIRAWLKQNALRRPVEVRASAGMDSPMTYGVLRPVILLPKGIDKGDTGRCCARWTMNFRTFGILTLSGN